MSINEIIFACNLCASEEKILLYEKNGFPIVRCRNCGLVSTALPFNFETRKIYDEGYFQGGQVDGYADYQSSEKILRAEFRKVVKKLRSHFTETKGKKLLEIGSAFGYFLDEAAASFECFGVEVNRQGVELSCKRGHRVFEGELNAAMLAQSGKVDAVVMLDVIEHLRDPSGTLKKLHQAMNPDGIILIATGNHSSALSRIMKKHWRLMTPPQHTFFFSAKTLKDILSKTGFRILASDTPWKMVPLGLPFYQIGRRTGFRIKALENINTWGIPVNLFDTVRVIAQK